MTSLNLKIIKNPIFYDILCLREMHILWIRNLKNEKGMGRS